MTSEVAIGIAALILNMLVIAVGYGVLKGTVAALSARVVALEGEMSTLSALKADVARIDERTKSMSSGIESILNSWLLREPPGYAMSDPAQPPRTRRRT